MGSMRRKKRRKLAKAWKKFQTEHELSDAEVMLARSAGYPLDRFLEKLATAAFCSLPIRQAISQIHEQKLAERHTAIASGLERPKAKKKKGSKHDPQWGKAKQLCRLNQEDIRKAKELGLGPKSLTKNIPNPNQQWKQSVKDWINELYEARFADGRTRPM